MFEKYNRELKGRKFRGCWSGSPVFELGDIYGFSANIHWQGDDGPCITFYTVDHIFELFKKGTWILCGEGENPFQLSTKHKEALRREISHIFESGANEIRIQEMVERFIINRGGLKG